MVTKPDDDTKYNAGRRGFLKQLALLTGSAALSDIAILAEGKQVAPEITAATNRVVEGFWNELNLTTTGLRLNTDQLSMLQSPNISKSAIEESLAYHFDRQTERVDSSIIHFRKTRAKFKEAFPDGFQKAEIDDFLHELGANLEAIGKTVADDASKINDTIDSVKSIHARRMEETNKLLTMSDQEFEAFASQRHQEALTLDKQYKDFFAEALKTKTEEKEEAAEKQSASTQAEARAALADKSFSITRNVRADSKTGNTIFHIVVPRQHDGSTHKTLESKKAFGNRTTNLKSLLEVAYPEVTIEETYVTRGHLFIHTPAQSRAHDDLEARAASSKDQQQSR